ncbi:hypothetical protein PL11201_410011 [Planktothrix sp. PCC 11201]|uniref:hypothetical protein n=1 Tax=Planktothrix sp. PCC 11201 TaxID=1729650 RepID=UPI00091427C9|nr:hypothetical protein [Planktothrix sp. PCC 11201]SKB12597.1 hypothetical protein PL11201_410011 [Planktothrix sp. PCC 11201]
MDCLRDHKQGRRKCDLVQLPNTTKEFMCTECKNQFIKKGESSDFDGVWILLIVCLLFFVFLLSGCSKQSKLLLIRIADSSASALNDPQQLKASKDTCFGLADASKTGDKQALIEVSQEVIATDPAMIKDSNDSYSLCHQKTESKGQGTYVCPALDLALEMSDRHPETPIIVLQIQANEGEEFCPDTLKNLANKVSSRQGKLLIIGSTNDGNTGFNTNLWSSLKDLPNTQFCNQNIRSCVKESIQQIRSK